MSDLENFASPHVHLESLDTGSTVEAFIDREVELGTGTVTATDHGSLAAVRKAYDLAKKKKLTMVPGIEAYFRDDNCSILQEAGAIKNEAGTYADFMKYGHVTLHMLDQDAYEACSIALSKADTRAEQHGSERKPLLDWSQLEQLLSHNVTVGTGCLVGMVQRHLVDRNDGQTALKYYQKLKSIAKTGNFYVEVFPHDCSRNWEDAIFVTLEGGEKVRFTAANSSYKGKTIRVSGEEIKADQLCRRSEWGTLEATQDYRKWNDRDPKKIVAVQRVEDYIENDCRPWSDDPDIQKATNNFMISLASKFGDPILISDDAHYAKYEDKIVQDVRLAQSGAWRFYGTYERQTSDQVFKHFGKTLGIDLGTFKGWLDSNKAWAKRFSNFEFNTPPSLPTRFYPTDTMAHLGKLVVQHDRMRWSDPKYVARFKKEIELLHNNGTIDLLPYFFLAEEVVRVHSERGVLTGPGRGSAAGLLLAFLLGITHVDPIEYDLSLERFLTLDRIKSGKLPDIDLDFPHRELIEGPNGWLQTRFGDYQAQISTNITLKLSSACKDVCRMTRGSVPDDVEFLTKRFERPPQNVDDIKHVFGYVSDDGKEVKGSITYDTNLKQFIERYGKEWGYVQKCLGLNRGRSRHPSAFVIMNQPIEKLIPLVTIGDVRATQFTAAAVEAMGGIKMDLLIVNAIRDIGDTVLAIQKRHNAVPPKEGVILAGRGLVPAHHLVPNELKWFDIWALPDDDAVYSDIISGKSETVFQFNTHAAIQWMKHFSGFRPNGKRAMASITDLAYFTSLDRPGPLDAAIKSPDGGKHNMLVEYARRIQGMPGSPDVLPIMEKLLPKTNGIMITQEQLQYTYQELTGCSGSEAEAFRRDVAKKLPDKIQKAFTFFFPRAKEKLGEDDARKAWDTFVTFAEYGFNMSHAVSYALIGYTCAWLKHYYPLEWWNSVLANALKRGKKDKIAELWQYCGHMIDMPDLSRAGQNFEIHNERIVAPIGLLQGIGEKAHTQLSECAPYADLRDLIVKIEEYKKSHGSLAKKLVKDKKTKEKVEKEVWQNGRSSVHRGHIYNMLNAGVLDKLLPEDIKDKDTLSKLAYYEQVFSETVNKKIKPVPEWYGKVGALALYIMRKEILQTYYQDLKPIIKELGRSDISEDKNRICWRTKPMMNGREVRILDTVRKPIPPQGLNISATAYIAEQESFPWKGQTAYRMTLDVDGESFKMVSWPRRDGSNIAPDAQGTVALVALSRFKDDKGFIVTDLEIIQRPVKKEEETDE